MAIVVTPLVASITGSNQATITTSSFTLNSGDIGIAFVYAQGFLNADPPPNIDTTPTDSAGRVWTLQASKILEYDGGREHCLYIFTTEDSGTGTVTFDWDVSSNTRAYSIARIQGAQSGTAVQVASDSETSAASIALTFNTYADSENVGFFCVVNNSQDTLHTNDTDISTGAAGSEPCRFSCAYTVDETILCTGSGGLDWAIVGIEIAAIQDVTITGTSGDADAVGGTATPLLTLLANPGIASALGTEASVFIGELISAVSGEATAGGTAIPLIVLVGVSGDADALGGSAITAVINKIVCLSLEFSLPTGLKLDDALVTDLELTPSIRSVIDITTECLNG